MLFSKRTICHPREKPKLDDEDTMKVELVRAILDDGVFVRAPDPCSDGSTIIF